MKQPLKRVKVEAKSEATIVGELLTAIDNANIVDVVRVLDEWNVVNSTPRSFAYMIDVNTSRAILGTGFLVLAQKIHLTVLFAAAPTLDLMPTLVRLYRAGASVDWGDVLDRVRNALYHSPWCTPQWAADCHATAYWSAHFCSRGRLTNHLHPVSLKSTCDIAYYWLDHARHAWYKTATDLHTQTICFLMAMRRRAINIHKDLVRIICEFVLSRHGQLQQVLVVRQVVIEERRLLAVEKARKLRKESIAKMLAPARKRMQEKLRELEGKVTETPF